MNGKNRLQRLDLVRCQHGLAIACLLAATPASAALLKADIQSYHRAKGTDADFFQGVVLTAKDLSTTVAYAAVVSKYIGETEKPLGSVFAPAGIADAVLLFDETDALFGKPGDAQDPNDPHADDFIVLDLASGTWFGQFYVDFDERAVPGIYALSGSFESFAPVPDVLALVGAAMLAMVAASRRRSSVR